MPPKKAASYSTQSKGNGKQPRGSVSSSAVAPDFKDAEVEYLGKVVTPKKLSSSRITDYFTKTPPKASLFSSTSDAKPVSAQGVLKSKNAASPHKPSPSPIKKSFRLRERKGNVHNCKNSNAATPITDFYDFEPSPAKKKERSVDATVPCVVRLSDIGKSIPDKGHSSSRTDNGAVVRDADMIERTLELPLAEQTRSQQSETRDPVDPPKLRRSVKRKSIGLKERTPTKRFKMEESVESNGCNFSDAESRSFTAKKSSMNLASPKLSFTSSISGRAANVVSRETSGSTSSGSQCNEDRKASRRITRDELTAAACTFRSISRKKAPASETEKYPMCESIESLFLVTCKSNYYWALRILQDNLHANCYPKISSMEILVWVILLGQQPKTKFIHGRRQTPKEMPPFPLSSRYEFVTACELLNKIVALHPPSVAPSLDHIYRRLLYANEDTAYEGWNKIEDLLLNCDFCNPDQDSLEQIMANIPQLPERQWFALRWFVQVLQTDLSNALAKEQPGHVERSITARIFWHKGKIGVLNYRTRRLTEILLDALVGDKRRALEEALKLLSFVATVIQKMDSDRNAPFQLNTLCQDLVLDVADSLQNWAQQSRNNMNEALHALKPAWLGLAICQRWLKQLDPDWDVPDADVTLSTVFSRYLTEDASYSFSVGEASLGHPALKLQALPPVLRTCVQRFLIAYQEHFGVRDILAILVQGVSCVETNEILTDDSSLSEHEYQHLLKDLKAVKSCKLMPTDGQSNKDVGLLII